VLDGVGFRYGGSERFALAEVSATLPAGSVVALVGENGAGKTTLVKLLTRMHEPTAGRILLDGADVAGLEVEGYRRGLSASFQDFVRFELSARDAVAIGDLERSGDDEAVRSALARARCEFVYELPRGWDTQLGRDWEGGVDLSGGQWQKLAIARGMMRREARLVVFDEPTASLDPRSEFEIFQQVAAEARSAAGERVTLLISHRFSTVRMADLILVLRDGRLVEQGTHEQLMALEGGLYAELYRLQARAYLAP
jgi:ATP-binding cassette subfamily B protein